MQQAIIGANDDPDLCRHYDITRPQWVNAADQFHNTWVKYMYLVHDVLTIFCIRYAHAYVALYFTKQITICAEYRDMVPKVKAGLSGTAGLRPIGRSPGVPDKPAEALVTMSRYSAQIFCFIFSTFQFLCGLGLGTLHTEDCRDVLCHCPQSSQWGCSSDNQLSQHALHGLRSWRMKTLSGISATELVKLTDEMDAIHINGKLFSTRPKWV